MTSDEREGGKIRNGHWKGKGGKKFDRHGAEDGMEVMKEGKEDRGWASIGSKALRQHFSSYDYGTRKRDRIFVRDILQFEILLPACITLFVRKSDGNPDMYHRKTCKTVGLFTILELCCLHAVSRCMNIPFAATCFR
jgi:hypothetical protein